MAMTTAPIHSSVVSNMAEENIGAARTDMLARCTAIERGFSGKAQLGLRQNSWRNIG